MYFCAEWPHSAVQRLCKLLQIIYLEKFEDYFSSHTELENDQLVIILGFSPIMCPTN